MNTETLGDLMREALEYQAECFDGPDDEDLSVSGADLVDWFAAWRERLKEVIGADTPAELLRATFTMDALLELRQYVVFNEQGPLTREQFDAMLARVDNATAGRAAPMETEELQRLFNGPLSHPYVGFVISRLMLAIGTMVTMSPGAAEALRAYCRSRDEQDQFKAQHG